MTIHSFHMTAEDQFPDFSYKATITKDDPLYQFCELEKDCGYLPICIQISWDFGLSQKVAAIPCRFRTVDQYISLSVNSFIAIEDYVLRLIDGMEDWDPVYKYDPVDISTITDLKITQADWDEFNAYNIFDKFPDDYEWLDLRSL